jgi:hypothetical protein
MIKPVPAVLPAPPPIEKSMPLAAVTWKLEAAKSITTYMQLS